jgi:hypothetical protein
MHAPVRTFEIKPAVRDAVPLLIGLTGPPGAGKTYSALTLAEGMRQVAGGPPVLIDTEGGRSKKYADLFDFHRIDFAAPFRPSDFLAAIEAAAQTNLCAIIIDSMSDEHEGEGGVLDWHDAELDRMAGSDWAKRERVGQAAWIKPKADRRTLINGMLQIQTPMIFCFRAREKVKQVRDDRGKMVPTNIGYQPIAPGDIIFAMDVTCLLPPKSDGTPVWKSDKLGEDFHIKLPEFFKPMFTEGQPITKDTGRALAAWAKGKPANLPVSQEPDQAANLPLEDEAREAAKRGRPVFSSMWKRLTGEQRTQLAGIQDELSKLMAPGPMSAAGESRHTSAEQEVGF